MNARCLLVLPALVLLIGCKGVTVDVGPGFPEPLPPPAGEPHHRPGPGHHDPYGHMVKRQSFTAMSDVELKDGCYVGNFVLGRPQLEISGTGLDTTVIHGNLVVKTQCTVSNLTVTGDVIFEGSQAELINVDFYGKIIDKGSQNRY